MESNKGPIWKHDQLAVRYLTKKDVPLLAKWLSDPKVLSYYEGRDNPFDEKRVLEKFFRELNNEAKCIIEYDHEPIGYLQYYEVDNGTKFMYGVNDKKCVFGMDQFVGETAYWNKGIGTRLIGEMTEYLFVEYKADSIVMDPQVRNKRALHVYEKCGFKKVKCMPNHEWHEGKYHDCWLIRKDSSWK
ncbi:N-acetyltransferase [Jeotgalibacillus sp. S-D1]|nr:N-acetyltransferase [Jeotgalibacillus sp. S-D1]